LLSAKEERMKREERKRKEQTLLHALIIKCGLKQDIFEAWRRETGRKKSAFYDRLDELSEEDRARYESLPDHRMLSSELLKELVIGIEDEDEIYMSNARVNSELATRRTKNDICEWWCGQFDQTASSFDVYWAALPEEIRALVSD
jgi:hypothetical protein